jgi:AraC family transcriptional regulator of adaptative response/methylated-DNA-[protein]-cysteine methyltransferase
MREPFLRQKDYTRIEKSLLYLREHLLYLREHLREQPRLETIARQAGLSPFHFQKIFKRWAGISPKTYLAYLTSRLAKDRLRLSKNVLDTTLETGLSSPGRLHDLMVKTEALTPGEIKSGGSGVKITYGFSESPFGWTLLGFTPRGICHLGFPGKGKKKEALMKLRGDWPKAKFKEDGVQAKNMALLIFGSRPQPLRVLLKGTPFQIKVWEALLQIPTGETRSYGEVAEKIGHSKAGRAVGSAVGANSVAYLIPCHRVIRGSGNLGGYSWGLPKKRVMLDWETARSKKLLARR